MKYDIHIRRHIDKYVYECMLMWFQFKTGRFTLWKYSADSSKKSSCFGSIPQIPSQKKRTAKMDMFQHPYTFNTLEKWHNGPHGAPASSSDKAWPCAARAKWWSWTSRGSNKQEIPGFSISFLPWNHGRKMLTHISITYLSIFIILKSHT